MKKYTIKGIINHVLDTNDMINDDAGNELDFCVVKIKFVLKSELSDYADPSLARRSFTGHLDEIWDCYSHRTFSLATKEGAVHEFTEEDIESIEVMSEPKVVTINSIKEGDLIFGKNRVTVGCTVIPKSDVKKIKKAIDEWLAA